MTSLIFLPCDAPEDLYFPDAMSSAKRLIGALSVMVGALKFGKMHDGRACPGPSAGTSSNRRTPISCLTRRSRPTASGSSGLGIWRAQALRHVEVATFAEGDLPVTIMTAAVAADSKHLWSIDYSGGPVTRTTAHRRR